MAIESQPRVLLFGAGSVGTIYLYLLSKVTSATAVCRSNYDVVKKDGFIINSSIFGQGIHFKPDVVRNCEEAAAANPTPFDYVVVCSKAIPGIIPKLIAPAITQAHTSIVLIQNGIGIEEEYQKAFPANPIISVAAYLPVSQSPPGVIHHGEVERLEVGIYPSNAPSKPAELFASLIKQGGGTVEFHADIQRNRWYKLLINASWNPICALTLSKDTAVLQATQEADDVLLAIMMEVREIAAAYGHDITVEEVEFQMSRAQIRVPAKAGIEPSMLQDIKAGRRMEVEAICGNVVRMAKAKGVRAVRLEVLYVLAKALDLTME